MSSLRNLQIMLISRNPHLACPLNNNLALEGRDVVRNLSCVLAIVHEQQLQLLRVVHHKLVKTCMPVSDGTWLLILCRESPRMRAAVSYSIDLSARFAERPSDVAPEQPVWE